MTPSAEQYNKDELEPPKWMDDAFFAKVLGQSENRPEAYVKVKNFKISPATVQGDHYASVMFRAVVDYECGGKDNSKPLIIKTMPDMEGHKKDMLGESYIFETEIGMYMEVLPRFEQILRSAGDATMLNARCLYDSLTPRKLIIFEDIVPKGYTVMRDRNANRTEVECVYMKLAKWHAISYKLNQEEPHFFAKYSHSFMAMRDLAKNEFMTEGIKYFLDMLDVEPTLSAYKPYFEPLRNNLLQKCIESFTEFRRAPREGATYVLCHGDFHLKNMMFKHNPSDGELQDVMLLDFQFSYIGPVILDLIYSYYMLLDSTMRSNFSEFLYFYHTHFTNTLKQIGYKGAMPRLRELHEQRVRHRHFEFFLMVTFWPMWFGVQVGKADPEELMTSAETRKSFYKSRQYVEELEKLLLQYLHAGYLEDL